MSSPPLQSVAFDTQPLLWFFRAIESDEQVKRYLAAVERGEIEASVSRPNLAELFYVGARLEDQQWADRRTTDLRNIGVAVVGDRDLRKPVARLKHRYGPYFPIGDAYALAAAIEGDVSLLVGDDNDWDDPIDDGYDVIRVGDL